MYGRVLALACLLGVLDPSMAFSGPKVAPNSDKLCSGYEETIEGVWVDQSGWETLRFRFASNADGTGCYAWLNPVAQWSIGSAGSDLMPVRREGAVRAWGDENRGIFVDLDAGTARYIRNGRTTRGKVIE